MKSPHYSQAAHDYVDKSPMVPDKRCSYAFLVMSAFDAGARHSIEECVKIAEDCGNSNVENPAINMFERQRRMGIRWCGEFIAARIRALANSPNGDESNG